MLSKHIQHYLCEEGVTYLPKWLTALAVELKKVPGFLHLFHAKGDSQCGEQHIILQFSDECALKRWALRPVHDTLRNDINRFAILPSKITYFDFVEY